MENLDALREELLSAVGGADSLEALEELRVSALGRKGRVTELMKGLGGLDPDERRAAGQALNAVKTAVSDAIEARHAGLADAALDAALAADRVDITLPVRPEAEGRLHPISQTFDEIIAIFGEMGFAVAEGPDIEDDFHNFTALNIPPEHPARQMHDTFYLPEKEDGERMLLRTHTSPVQIRTMVGEGAPVRIIELARRIDGAELYGVTAPLITTAAHKRKWFARAGISADRPNDFFLHDGYVQLVEHTITQDGAFAEKTMRAGL